MLLTMSASWRQPRRSVTEFRKATNALLRYLMSGVNNRLIFSLKIFCLEMCCKLPRRFSTNGSMLPVKVELNVILLVETNVNLLSCCVLANCHNAKFRWVVAKMASLRLLWTSMWDERVKKSRTCCHEEDATKSTEVAYCVRQRHVKAAWLPN